MAIGENYPNEIEIKNIMPDNSTSALIPAMMASQNNQGGFGGMGGIGGILIGALLGGGLGGGLGGWGNRGGVGGAGAAAIGADLLLAPQFQGIQGQINTLAANVNNNNVLDQITDGNMQNLAGITSVNQNISGVARDTLNSIANVATAQAAANYTNLVNTNALGRDFTAAQTQSLIQGLNTANITNGIMQQGFNEIGRDSATSTNQIIAQGTQNAFAMQQCCCEIQRAIASDGATTRALINDINFNTLNTQLNDAKVQISNTTQTIALENFATTLVTRLFPSGPVVV